MNTITVSEAASKLGKNEGELYGYTHLRTIGDALTPQRWWLYIGCTDDRADKFRDQGTLRRIVPND